MYESPYKPQPDASVPGRKMVPPLHKQSATETVTSCGKAGTGYCAVIAGQARVTYNGAPAAVTVGYLPAIVYPDTEALQPVLRNPHPLRHIRTNPINGIRNKR